MPISVVFDPPLPSDSPSTFNTKAFTLLGDLNDWSTQANALPGEFASDVAATLAAPPAIGSTTPAAGSFTTLSAGITKVNSATNSGNTVLGVKVATDAQLWVRPGTELGGSAGVGIQSSNDAGSGSTALTLYGSSIKLDGGAVTIPGSLSLTGGTLGYGTGAGGTVTQATSKSTAVTLNKPCGYITLHAASLAAGATVQFVFNNSLITYSDLLHVQYDQVAASPDYNVWVSLMVGGQAFIVLKNISGGALAESFAIRFAVIKGVTS